MFATKSILTLFGKYPECRAYSIWDFCLVRRTYNYFGQCNPCRYEIFPYIYWFVMFIALNGLVRSFSQLLTLLLVPQCPLRMWRRRKFHFINICILRQMRLYGVFLMVIIWAMLVYGLLTTSSNLLLPWLLLHAIMLLLEACNCCLEMLKGQMQLKFLSLLPLLRLGVVLLLVNCIRCVFQAAISSHLLHSLRISSIFK
ncbi:uncharacterized protein LOC108605730 [Drosophila busckii]|uniref:uncharacterized protein LOC108605730 n=1 Tax=Drosophila busckii TaxID=30019 RepID=UPI00083F1DFC|nr:uncharacterized protein LOC108605730 [Drosophila busckii]